MDKRITLLIVAASSLMLGTGCSKKITTINDIEIINVSDAKVDSTKTYKREFISVDPDDIENYDVLEISSKNVTIDDKGLEYKLDITFKNKSKKPIKNLYVNLALYSPNENSVDTIELEELKPNDTIQKSLALSLDGMVDTYFNGKKPTKKEIEKTLSAFFQDDNDFFKFDYSYNNLKSDESIYVSYDFDSKFNVLNSFARKSKELNEQEQSELLINHKDNGMYLNLIKPEAGKEFTDIEVLNITANFDEDYNFSINGKFKNISNKELNDFKFNSSMHINEVDVPIYVAPDTSNSVVNTVKPNEEFEVQFVINNEDLFTFMEEGLLQEIPLFKGKNKSQVLSNSIRNRDLNFSFIYEYSDKKYNVYGCNSYDSNSKLVSSETIKDCLY